MKTIIGGRVGENTNEEDALSNIMGVAQVLSHFSMNEVDVCEFNPEMFAMLSAVLEDACATLAPSKDASRSDSLLNAS